MLAETARKRGFQSIPSKDNGAETFKEEEEDGEERESQCPDIGNNMSR